MQWDNATAVAVGVLITWTAVRVVVAPSCCALMSGAAPSPTFAMSECGPALAAITLASVGQALTLADRQVAATLSIFTAAAFWLVMGTTHICA
jgi:hypothetical protein